MKTNDVTRITGRPYPACWLAKGHGRTAPLYIWTRAEWLNYRPLIQATVIGSVARVVTASFLCTKLRSRVGSMRCHFGFWGPLGVAPEEWHQGIIIPLWKGKGSRSDYCNCRGIKHCSPCQERCLRTSLFPYWGCTQMGVPRTSCDGGKMNDWVKQQSLNAND